jgi:hypothetical protein
MFLYACVNFSCSIMLIFCYIQRQGPECFFCPAPLLTNEGLFQLANQDQYDGTALSWPVSFPAV